MEDIMVEVVAVVDEGAWMFVVRNWLPVAGKMLRTTCGITTLIIVWK